MNLLNPDQYLKNYRPFNFSLQNCSKTTVFVLAGSALAGCAFIGYAIYFDYKRRSAKGYKARLRVKRKVQFGQLDKESGSSTGSYDLSNNSESEIFNSLNMVGMQQFFLQEVQLGEEKLLEGFVEEGIQHLAMAIVMCNRPEQVISIFRQTLADEHFALLNLAVPTARQRLAKLAEHQANSRNKDSQH